ncbi:hypothetical protein Droror1_Dr00024474 [Drosera rotundifolia]
MRRRQEEGKPPTPSSPLQVLAVAIPGVPQSTARTPRRSCSGPGRHREESTGSRESGRRPLCLPRAALRLSGRSLRLTLDFPKQFVTQIRGEVPPSEEKLHWSSCLRSVTTSGPHSQCL